MNRQIIPFPLPVYLATYFGNRLATIPTKLRDGSHKNPFLVSGHNDYGDYILRHLTVAHAPHIYKGKHPFFISVSNWQGNTNWHNVSGKRNFICLDNIAVKKVTEKLNAAFRAHMITFVRGAESVTSSKSENKRVRTLAIRNFCEENHVIYSDKNLVAWKKMCQRNKHKPKTLIYSTL